MAPADSAVVPGSSEGTALYIGAIAPQDILLALPFTACSWCVQRLPQLVAARCKARELQDEIKALQAQHRDEAKNLERGLRE